MSRYRIGIDVGGTFTDLYLHDQQTGVVARHKLLSTPGRPHVAPLQGIREILKQVGQHAESKHNLKVTPDLAKKVEGLIHDDSSDEHRKSVAARKR